jgi:hypothetical protein
MLKQSHAETEWRKIAMAEKPAKHSPPYAAFASFITFINKLRDTQIPGRIDPSVFGNASGSLSYSIIAALKALKLIGADGVPTAEFVSFVRASDEERKPMMQTVLKAGYPSLWQGEFDLASATAGQFDEHIRSEYEVKGSTVDKVATFFIAAAKYAELPISSHLAARKPTATSASAGKSKRQRRDEGDNNGNGNGGTPPLPSSAPITEKALEYRLVDLMTDAMGDPEVMQAIIKVVTFLKTRDAAKKTATDQ